MRRDPSPTGWDLKPRSKAFRQNCRRGVQLHSLKWGGPRRRCSLTRPARLLHGTSIFETRACTSSIGCPTTPSLPHLALSQNRGISRFKIRDNILVPVALLISFLLIPFILKGREKFWAREKLGKMIRKPKNKNALCPHLAFSAPGKDIRVCKIIRAQIRHMLWGQWRQRRILSSRATVSACPADSMPAISSEPWRLPCKAPPSLPLVPVPLLRWGVPYLLLPGRRI